MDFRGWIPPEAKIIVALMLVIMGCMAWQIIAWASQHVTIH